MECDREEASAYLIGALGDGTLYTISDVPHKSVKQFVDLIGTEHPSKKEKFASLFP